MLKADTVTFADVAHQSLVFERSHPAARLVLELIDTPWIQRLRNIRQTGNTNLVYMFSEHSRFGHSLGVAYLALQLMEKLSRNHAEKIAPFEKAVAAAAILHDVGHVAPGSHLGARLWATDGSDFHEFVSERICEEDPEISAILRAVDPELPSLVRKILAHDPSLPPWTSALISGSGWNADRGNWTIVDSAMCSVTYGRYNVRALIDAYTLSADGELVLHESRLDALTHFFVARDSMYRQVYQHRVLQSADALTVAIITRLRDLLAEQCTAEQCAADRGAVEFFADQTMRAALASKNYATELSLSLIFSMTESWWLYHIAQWCSATDPVLRDLALRLRDRKLFKTVRLPENEVERREMITVATKLAQDLGLDAKYYVHSVSNLDQHRKPEVSPPKVLLESGGLTSVYEIEPMLNALNERPAHRREWLVLPGAVKEKLGRAR
ncbi:HD domain-containing protein [bacterium]|nr:HD domain-containing protein [bacterium]